MATVQSTTLELNFAPAESRLIPMRNRIGEVVAHVIVDADVFEWASQYQWSANDGPRGVFYARGKINGQRTYLHRRIMNAPEGMQVDHINGNRLDNRRCNLRLVTSRQNCMNNGGQKHKTSKYVGVCWFPDCSKWRAVIVYNRKQYHLGLFDSEEEAARVRDAKAIELFGEYARLNFPLEAQS